MRGWCCSTVCLIEGSSFCSAFLLSRNLFLTFVARVHVFFLSSSSLPWSVLRSTSTSTSSPPPSPLLLSLLVRIIKHCLLSSSSSLSWNNNFILKRLWRGITIVHPLNHHSSYSCISLLYSFTGWVSVCSVMAWRFAHYSTLRFAAHPSLRHRLVFRFHSSW